MNVISDCATNWTKHTVSENCALTCLFPTWSTVSDLATFPSRMLRTNEFIENVAFVLCAFTHCGCMKIRVRKQAWIQFRIIAPELSAAFCRTILNRALSAWEYLIFLSAISTGNNYFSRWLLASVMATTATHRTKLNRAPDVIGARSGKSHTAKFADKFNVLTRLTIFFIALSLKFYSTINTCCHSHCHILKGASRRFGLLLLSRQHSNQRDARMSDISSPFAVLPRQWTLYSEFGKMSSWAGA